MLFPEGGRMKSKVLIALTTVFVGAFGWIACETKEQGVAAGAVPSSESPPPGVVDAVGLAAQVERTGSDKVERGSPAHRARLAERTRRDFEQRLERWTAAGKSEAFIAYMRERGLEQRLRDLRTKPPEWFSIEAVQARTRALNERDTALFLDAGFPPEQVEALVRSSTNPAREPSDPR